MINQTSAKIILDSISPSGYRLTTMEITMWRAILAEKNTHRKHSKNSASSRAIPLSKQISKVMEDPFVPKRFGKNQSGMQSFSWLSDEDDKEAKQIWLKARDAAVYYTEKMGKLDVHKQWAARLLEPFMWHTVVVSSTEWQNFFDQRCSRHGMAQPEMGELADRMEEALNASTPKVLLPGQWHLPYLSDYHLEMPLPDQMKISVAKCAAVSYGNQSADRSVDKDIALWDRLKTGKHLSPSEHVATPSYPGTGNFDGWDQLRWWQERDSLSVLGL